ncbi:unnamed protein product [Calicophoron daubneyi]|uniref:Uncharacterized protein n=1 Tax=Calicophoron daubneyi TaxID=300641 RepID=A0AAV2T4Z9_CALDB
MVREQLTLRLTCSTIIMFSLLHCLQGGDIKCFHEKRPKSEGFDREKALGAEETEDNCKACTTTIVDKDEEHIEQRTCSVTDPVYDTVDQLDIVFDPTTRKTLKKEAIRMTNCYQDSCNGESANTQDQCKIVIQIPSRGLTSFPKTSFIILLVLVLNNICAFLLHV